MKKITGLALTGLLLLFVASVYTPSARAAETDYLYCKLIDEPGGTVYYTNVILGDMARKADFEKAFVEYLQGIVYKYKGTATATCVSTKAFKTTLTKEDGERATDTSGGKKIVNTGWTWAFDGPYGYR